jgi:hypothetical protein
MDVGIDENPSNGRRTQPAGGTGISTANNSLYINYVVYMSVLEVLSVAVGEPALILTDVREVLTRLARSPLLITKRDTAGEVLG